jgi:transcriptional regulator with XRE-family HTH domain
MIYKNICDYLNRSGKTEKDLAEILGISIPYMNLLKHGKRRPSPELALKIERITRIPLRKLLIHATCK